MTANFWRSFSCAVILFLLLREGCHWHETTQLEKALGKCKEAKPEWNPIEVTRIDSVRVTDTFNKVVLKPYAVVKHQVDSFIAFDRLPVDTAAILKDYYSKVYYKDSSLTKWGAILIMDTITKNRIAGRSVITDFTIPVVTNTITKSIEQKKRNQVYIGLNLQGKADDYLFAAGPSLMFKTKSDKAFEIGALFNKGGYMTYQAGLKWNISFH